MKLPAPFTAALIAAALLFAAHSANSQVVVASPFSGSVGDMLSRGFYVQGYAGSNLSTVQLAYGSFASGNYSASLTARLGAFDGPMIGSTVTASFTLNGTLTNETVVTYDFGGATVTPGSTITFTQNPISGPGTIYYDIGSVTGLGVFETEGTTAPLDTVRNSRVGVYITQIPEPATCAVLAGFAVLDLAAYRRRKQSV